MTIGRSGHTTNQVCINPNLSRIYFSKPEKVDKLFEDDKAYILKIAEKYHFQEVNKWEDLYPAKNVAVVAPNSNEKLPEGFFDRVYGWLRQESDRKSFAIDGISFDKFSMAKGLGISVEEAEKYIRIMERDKNISEFTSPKGKYYLWLHGDTTG